MSVKSLLFCVVALWPVCLGAWPGSPGCRGGPCLVFVGCVLALRDFLRWSSLDVSPFPRQFANRAILATRQSQEKKERHVEKKKELRNDMEPPPGL